MTKMTGFYWHVHHDILLEWCYNAQERIHFIKQKKPLNQRETRLKWMVSVKGELPAELIKAEEACTEAKDAFGVVWDAYVLARITGRADARENYYKAVERDTFNKALIAYNKALRDHKHEIEALHAIEHPGCPWDGTTLVFPE